METSIAVVLCFLIGAVSAISSFVAGMQNRKLVARVDLQEAALTSEIASWLNLQSNGATSGSQGKDSQGRYYINFPNDYTADLPTLPNNSYNSKAYISGTPMDLLTTMQMDFEGKANDHSIVRRVSSTNVEYVPPPNGSNRYCGEMTIATRQKPQVYRTCVQSSFQFPPGGGPIQAACVNPNGENVDNGGDKWFIGPPADCTIDPAVAAQYKALSKQPWNIVKNENDIMNMKGGNNYVLANNITTDAKYITPLLVKSILFDGNGYTITFPSGGGLFGDVRNSVVQNLNLHGAQIASVVDGVSCVNKVASNSSGIFSVGNAGAPQLPHNVVIANTWSLVAIGGVPPGGSLINTIYAMGTTTIARSSFCGDTAPGGGFKCMFGGSGPSWGGLIGTVQLGTGYVANPQVTIDQTYFSGNVRGCGCASGWGSAAGFVGTIASSGGNYNGNLTISNSGYLGNVSCLAGGVGGFLAGAHNTTIVNSFFNGTITNSGTSGGLIGGGDGILIKNSFARGAIVPSVFNGFNPAIGGLVGSISGTIQDSFSYVAISPQNPLTPNPSIGGVIGSVQTSATINNTYFSGSLPGSGNVGGINPPVGKNSPLGSYDYFDDYQTTNSGLPTPENTAWLQNPSSYSSTPWDFTNTWAFQVGNYYLYPTLKWCDYMVNPNCLWCDKTKNPSCP